MKWYPLQISLSIFLIGMAHLIANPSENYQQIPLQESHERGGLPNFFAKLEHGDPVRIAYLGGSITAQNGWRPKTLKWFQEKFPTAKIGEINAAIGGTGSDLGVFRLRHDVLNQNPDLLFIEFAVNDAGASVEQIHRCMEGIVRQTWRNNPLTDICFVYTLAGNMLEDLKLEKLPRSIQAMEQLANHYQIFSINLGLEVARMEKKGQLLFKGTLPKTEEEKISLGKTIVFSPDSVHPYPETGHQLYLEAIIRSLSKIKEIGTVGNHKLPTPMRADNWEQAQMIPINKTLMGGPWYSLDASTNNLAKNFGRFLPELWMAEKPGNFISFRFRGSVARIYDVMGPDCGQLSIQIDDQKERIQPRFDAYCTYHRLNSFSVVNEEKSGEHTVRISIHAQSPDKPKILAQRQEKMDSPKRFEGRRWYVGAILIVGEILH